MLRICSLNLVTKYGGNVDKNVTFTAFVTLQFTLLFDSGFSSVSGKLILHTPPIFVEGIQHHPCRYVICVRPVLSLQGHLCHIDTYQIVEYSVRLCSFQRSVEDVFGSVLCLVGCKAFGSIQSCVKLSSFTVVFMLGLILVLWHFAEGPLMTRLSSLPSSTKNQTKQKKKTKKTLSKFYPILQNVLDPLMVLQMRSSTSNQVTSLPIRVW